MAAPTIKRIAVGVDGSVHADAALQWTIAMARGMASEVIAIFAITPPLYFDTGYAAPTIPVEYDTEWRTEVKQEFEQKWTKPLRDAGVKHQAIMRDGRAASVINEVAEELNADIIVVGRRGRGGVAELLLGSVSHELVLHSRRPVLVISGPPGMN